MSTMADNGVLSSEDATTRTPVSTNVPSFQNMSRTTNAKAGVATGKEMMWWLNQSTPEAQPAHQENLVDEPPSDHSDSTSERVSLIWPKDEKPTKQGGAFAVPSIPHSTPCGGKETQALSPASRGDAYWFAHGGGEMPAMLQQPAMDRTSDSGFSEGKEASPPLNHQREREERVRHVREQQEAERQRRALELQTASLQAQRHREQLEEERRRRMEELRQREMERRQAVEERKKQIWEAEKERKEAIMRRNLEREARIEARRNAQRNSMSFAFGSSTPRTFDLELASMGGPAILLSATSSKKPEDGVDVASKRVGAFNVDFPTDPLLELDSNSSSLLPLHHNNLMERPYPSGMRSDEARACLTYDDTVPFFNSTITKGAPGPPSGFLTGSGALVIGEDLMTQSATSLSGGGISRARRKTDLVPTIPWEGRGSSLASASRARSPASTPLHPSRAVSMTRLDQLSQPRRRYLDTSLKNARMSSSMSSATSPSTMAKSMISLHSSFSSPYFSGFNKTPHKKPSSGPMSHSILNLSAPSQMSASMPSSAFSPSTPTKRNLSHSSSLKSSPLSKSMLHLGPPRPTRASLLRSDLSREGNATSAAGSTGRDNIRPPSRPRSSMSQASEMSTSSMSVSGVTMRNKGGTPGQRGSARGPRPYSIAGPLNSPASDHAPSGATTPISQKQHTARSSEKKGIQSPTRTPTPRAKSAGPPDSASKSKQVKPTPPPKPASLRKPPLATSTPNIKQQPSPPEQTKIEAIESPPPIVEVPVNKTPPDSTPPPAEETPGLDPNKNLENPSDVPKPLGNRITSEEEARAALAEKRRLAREQAEREAELERQRQEEERKREEEQRRREEEEQRRAEEEQERLAELQRKAEQERLQKAIEEQKAKEAEELQRKEEEQRLKAEREEQERLAREEAERQRKELEEKLRREEAERAERKKRVEQIMSRTRGRGTSNAAQTALGLTSSPSEETKSSESSLEQNPEQPLENGLHNNSDENNRTCYNNNNNTTTTKKPLQEDNLVIHSSPHSTNGCNGTSHDVLSEDSSMPSTNALATTTATNGHHATLSDSLNQHIEQLLDLENNTLNSSDVIDQVNSNPPPSNPLIAFEDSVSTPSPLKKQDSPPLVDFLS